MFKVKICGLTRKLDVVEAVAAGADALGFNFFPGSKRFVAADDALDLVAAVPKGVKKIGVFVNAERNEIEQIVERLNLDAIQLHGDESPEFLASFRGIPVIRSFSARPGFAKEINDYLQSCTQFGVLPAALLLDAFVPGEFGGTGTNVPQESLREIRAVIGMKWPLILAGGLNPSNVRQAILHHQPEGVDVASGVESTPGIKDANQMQAFVQAALAALDGR